MRLATCRGADSRAAASSNDCHKLFPGLLLRGCRPLAVIILQMRGRAQRSLKLYGWLRVAGCGDCCTLAVVPLSSELLPVWLGSPPYTAKMVSLPRVPRIMAG